MTGFFKNYRMYADLEKMKKLKDDFMIAQSAINKIAVYEDIKKTYESISAFIQSQRSSVGLSNSILEFYKFVNTHNEIKTLLYEIDLLKLESSRLKGSEKSIILNEAKRVKSIITDIYNNNLTLYEISPREFEIMIAEILNKKGFQVELTKQTRDNGYDIIALKDCKSEFPLKFLVECKRYTNQKVGVDIIRSFKDVLLTEKANKGVIVTTSYFTSEAKKKRIEIPYLLDFRDKDEVINWVNEYYLEVISR